MIRKQSPLLPTGAAGRPRAEATATRLLQNHPGDGQNRAENRSAFTYYSNRERAEETMQAIIGAGGEAVIVKYDLANDESIRQTVQVALEKWGTIDVLVNNAVQWGDHSFITHPPLFEDVPAEIWGKFIRTNFEGVYLTIQQVVPVMRKQRWGRIVSLSSSIIERHSTRIDLDRSYYAGHS